MLALKMSLETVVMPVLSHTIRDKEIRLRALRCLLVKTPHFCHQNLSVTEKREKVGKRLLSEHLACTPYSHTLFCPLSIILLPRSECNNNLGGRDGPELKHTPHPNKESGLKPQAR